MVEENDIIDPAFLRDSNYSYVNYDDKELATVLCFSLARHNKDLILHQQRIELYAKQNNRELLYTALIDLFIALGNKGIDYKKRIFFKNKNKITIRQSILLKKLLNSKNHATIQFNNLKESILTFGIDGELLTSKFI